MNNRQCTYNLTLCHIRVLFASPRLSEQPDTTALEDSNSNTYLGLHVQCPKFFPDCNKIWIASKIFSLQSPLSNFTVLCRVGAALKHAQSRTDMRKEALLVTMRMRPQN